jgi:hypothetical protein
MTTDGGPAYPGDCVCNNGRAGCANCGFGKVAGLSKLDRFAMAAMQAFVGRTDGAWTDAPRYAFRVAEAMLAESERRKADGG